MFVDTNEQGCSNITSKLIMSTLTRETIPDIDKELLAETTRKRRADKSLRKAASEAGINASILLDVERGGKDGAGRQDIGLQSLLRVCAWLDTPIDHFVIQKEPDS